MVRFLSMPSSMQNQRRMSPHLPLRRVREYVVFEPGGNEVGFRPLVHFGTHVRERKQSAASRYEVEWLEPKWLRKLILTV